MRYEIKGSPLPVVECTLEAGESIICEGGSMSWMSANMQMETSGGGIGKMFSKAISGEKLFHNKYTATGSSGIIAFASSFPGNILAVEIAPGKEIVCQKSAFLAATPGVDVSIFFQKKLGSGFFGGEGFIMQKISGQGIVFLEIDGYVETKELAPGEQIVIDTGYLAMMSATCSMDVQMVKGVKNVFLGGEGLFNTVVTGPGTISLQTMPAYQVANSIRPYIPTRTD
ncbi:MAG: TIGR00266 family protein [Lachnospiraceae bacterium]|nr:TIGR00266 family protein [Lachnospiraceae bacterium]